MKKTILEQANEIVNKRSEEKARQYGPFSEGMEKTAKMVSLISGKEFTADDMFITMIALKLSRQSYCKKEDNLLDLVAYVGAWQNYIDEQPSPQPSVTNSYERVYQKLSELDKNGIEATELSAKQLQDFIKGDDWAFEPEEA